MRATFDDVVPSLRRVVGSLSSSNRAIRVLEAGCGSSRRAEWLFQLKPGSEIVGIDTSAEAIEENPILTEKIIGDIQTYPLRANEFDLIICYFVLEHLPRPTDALQNFVRATKPNGLIVLAVPLVNSIKGLITKVTPYRFHVFVYRYLKRYQEAGKPGHAPFPTYLRLAITPKSLVQFATDNHLSIEYLQPYSSWEALVSNPALIALGRFASHFIELITFGKVPLENSDLMIIMRKRDGAPKDAAHN